MAKGQLRSNKEVKKPKKVKATKPAAGAFEKGSATPVEIGKKRG